MKHVVFVDSTVSGLLAFEAAKQLGCHVTFIHQRDASFLTISIKDDTSRLEPYLRYVDTYLRIDNLEDGELSQLLANLHAERPIDALISTSEAAILPVAREAQRIGTLYPRYEALWGRYIRVDCGKRCGHTVYALLILEVLSEEQLINGVVPSLSLPFVVKPTRGFAKQFSAICHSQADFDAFLAELHQNRKCADPMIDRLVSRDYLVEQYIDGTLHSAEVIVQDAKVSCFATTIRFRADYSELLEMTATMPSGLDASQRDEIKAYVQAVFSALGLDVGLYHVELLRDSKGPCLVEINARMMGSVAPQMYRMLTGIDPFELLVRLHLGEPILIDDSALQRAGSVVTVASRNGGLIANDYAPDTLQSLLDKYDIRFCTAHVAPGQAVNVYSGNIGTIGHVIIEDDCPYTAAKKGIRFLRELSSLYGLELATYTGVELA